LWRKYLQWRFNLHDYRRHDRLVIEHVAGKPFLVLPQVFNPALFSTSEFLVNNLNNQLVPSGSFVLDLGTGSGVGAVFAAQWAGQVIAIDNNPAAVRCAQINMLLNEVDKKVSVSLGDLFATLQNQVFDVILFNPPYFQGDSQTPLEGAFYSNGLAERFGEALPNYLSPRGHCLLILSSLCDQDRFLQTISAASLKINPLIKKDILTETLFLYSISHKKQEGLEC
jgi:release factor glutamine methyltransferase